MSIRFVDIRGVLQKARRFVSQTDNLQEEQVKDPQKLGEVLRGIMRRLGAVEAATPPDGMEFEVNVGENGTLVQLQHNFGQNVRHWVTDWRQASAVPQYSQVDKPASVAQMGVSVGTWTAAVVANTTFGASFRLKNNRAILGIRFNYGHNAKNMKLCLWRNDTGALVASTTKLTTRAFGVYEAYFSSPVETDLTGTDITVSYLNTTDSNNTFNNSTAWSSVVPYELNGDLTAVHQALATAGDVRPVTPQVGGYYMVEPILGVGYSGPALSVDATTTKEQLVLKSYVAGKAVIRVEPTQNGAS